MRKNSLKCAKKRPKTAIFQCFGRSINGHSCKISTVLGGHSCLADLPSSFRSLITGQSAVFCRHIGPHRNTARRNSHQGLPGLGRLSFSLSRKGGFLRSEEHTSELQSLRHLVCRLLL